MIDIKQLQVGDIIQHNITGDGYTVMSENEEHILAHRVLEISNPQEWILVKRSEQNIQTKIELVKKETLFAFAKKLHDKSEKYYQEWTFCQDHKFELEAKLKRELSDTIARIVLDLEHEFDIDVQY